MRLDERKLYLHEMEWRIHHDVPCFETTCAIDRCHCCTCRKKIKWITHITMPPPPKEHLLIRSLNQPTFCDTYKYSATSYSKMLRASVCLKKNTASSNTYHFVAVTYTGDLTHSGNYIGGVAE